MTLRICGGLLALVLAAGSAYAQRMPLYQSGTAIPNAVAKFSTNGMASPAGGTSGDALGRGVAPYAITDDNTPGLCSNSGQTGTGHQYSGLCLGHGADGGGLLSLDSYGGAPDRTLTISAPTIRFLQDGFEYPLGTLGGANMDLSNVVKHFARKNLGIASISPVDYGAVCDGQSHKLSALFNTLDEAQVVYPTALSLDNEIDGVAINNAFAEARSNYAEDNTGKAYVILPQGVCLSDISINATMLRNGVGVDVLGHGNVIKTTAAGKIAFDMLGSQRVSLRGITIRSPEFATAPAYGLQFGRFESAFSPDGFGSSDSMNFEDITVYGYYVTASVKNVASEDVVGTHPFFQNLYIDCCDPENVKSYAYIADSYNHWNVTSEYATVTIPVDRASSMTQNMWTGGEFRSATTNPAVWLGGSRGHTFNGGYFLSAGGDTDGDNTTSGGTSDYVIELHSDLVPVTIAGVPFMLGTPTDNIALQFNNVHVENHYSNHVFRLTGTNPTPRLEGFVYRDAQSFPRRIFGVGPDITKAYILDSQLHVPLGFWNNLVHTDNHLAFDEPEKFVISGNWFMPQRNRFNLGALLEADVRVCFNNTAPVVVEACIGPVSLIASDATRVVNDTAFTGGVALKTVHLPRLGPNDGVRVNALFGTSGGATNAKNMFVRISVGDCTVMLECINGTAFHNVSLATAGRLTERVQLMIHNRGATNAQIFYPAAGDGGAGVSGFHETTGAIETGGGAYIIFACSKAVDTDTCSLESYTVEVVPGKSTQ